jgi:gentisate 1,2-dioxygenase
MSTNKPAAMTNGKHHTDNSLPVSSVDELLKGLKSINSSPLWAQMARLNPAAPNPTTVPFLWEYERIRPYLLSAGTFVTEKQAERRVLMLINPNRSEFHAERRLRNTIEKEYYIVHAVDR